ncbi:MAG: hypothetical protein AAF614_31480 [Chloroflexota bacterium]
MLRKRLLETEKATTPFPRIHPRLLQAAPFLVTVLLAIWWGLYPSEDAFRLLQTARRFDLLAFAESKQPLYLLALWLVNAPTTAVILTTLGWIATAYALWQWLTLEITTTKTPIIVASVLLLAIHPAQFASVGAGLSWTTAVSLLLLLTLKQERPDPLIALLALLLFGVWLDWTTAVFLTLLLANQYHKQRTVLPLTTAVFLLGTAATAYLAWQNGLGLNLTTLQNSLSPTLSQLFYESNLYWLAVPLLPIGLWHSRQNPHLLIWLVWTGLLFTKSLALGQIVGAVSFVWLLAHAAQQLIAWLEQQRAYQVDASLPPLLVGAIGAVLAFGLAGSLAFRQQLRPFSQFAAEDELVGVLETAVSPPTRLAASARLAYLLDTPTHIWHGANQTGTDVLALTASRPGLLILPNTHWAREISNSVWVQANYQPQVPLPQNNLTLLQKIPQPAAQAKPRTITTFTEFGLTLETVQIAPRTIIPGDTVQMQLNWRAGEQVRPFGTVLNLTNPIDGTPYAQIDIITPNNLSNPWLTEGTLLPASYEFTTVEEIPIGAYPITLILRQPDSLEPEPITHPDDVNILDRRILDYVAVPWQGEMHGQPIGASFADGILLQQAEIMGGIAASNMVQVTLFWQTEATPSQNYTIFVHVLDEAGQFVTGADGVAFNGRYPTRGWHPGDTIPSEHTLILPADLPAGQHQIKVGLYLPSTGDRLTATTAAGEQPPDKAIVVGE